MISKAEILNNFVNVAKQSESSGIMAPPAAAAFKWLCLRDPRGLMPGILDFQNWREVPYGTFDDSSASGFPAGGRTQARSVEPEVSETAGKDQKAVQRRKNA
ncbi:hypothetical protein [Faecalibaculum rodentium]|uniref:hypothetical protein n=1 Tax=Faecalibaculum rodentium TaxID=1702221 RepID=UPI0023F3511D|nr:hypothetical protein [Faecalibaculum rodentium]